MLLSRAIYPFNKAALWVTMKKTLSTRLFDVNATTSMFLCQYFHQLIICERIILIFAIEDHTHCNIPMYLDIIRGYLSFQSCHNDCNGILNNQPHVYTTDYEGADQRKLQSSMSLAFVPGIHRWPVNSLQWIPAQRASYAENVPIWWCHHDCNFDWRVVKWGLNEHFCNGRCKKLLMNFDSIRWGNYESDYM